jgi:hypothetical protein
MKTSAGASSGLHGLTAGMSFTRTLGQTVMTALAVSLTLCQSLAFAGTAVGCYLALAGLNLLSCL